MADQSIIVSQDLCGAGAVSLGAALPILAALGLRPRVLPTALLSTHTGIPDNTYLDLSGQIAPILRHWATVALNIGGLYLGYLGPQALAVWREQLPRLAALPLRVVDPAIADGGKLYCGLDADYVTGMRNLLAHATLVTPNVTEAQLLLGRKPTTKPVTAAAAQELAAAFFAQFQIPVVLTGIALTSGRIGVASAAQQTVQMQTTEALPGHYFGTGDMFASVLAGRLLQGRPLQTAIASAMDFIARAIAVTNQAAEADNPLQDVNFGPVLPTLAAASTRAESEERP